MIEENVKVFIKISIIDFYYDRVMDIEDIISKVKKQRCLLLHKKYHIYKDQEPFFCTDENWKAPDIKDMPKRLECTKCLYPFWHDGFVQIVRDGYK